MNKIRGLTIILLAIICILLPSGSAYAGNWFYDDTGWQLVLPSAGRNYGSWTFLKPEPPA